MIDEALKNQIKWYDTYHNEAKDELYNYETYINYVYKDRIKRINDDYYIDDHIIDWKIDIAKIAEQMFNDIHLNKKSNIKMFVRGLGDANLDIIKDDKAESLGGMVIGETYVEEFDIIQDNIDHSNDEISEILDLIDKTEDNDWDIYKKWRINGCMYNTNKNGEITGVDMCYNNIINWLGVFPYTKGSIKYNNVRSIVTWNNRSFTDYMLHQIMQLINKYLCKDFSSLKSLMDAINGYAFKNKYNKWIEYFDSLEYVDDGIDYIDYTIKNVLCCEEQEKYYKLYYETLKMMYLGSMQRIYYKESDIRVKYDTVVVFCGTHGGSGKTTYFEKLFDIENNGDTYCYVVSGDAFSPKDKDFLQRTHQSVCVLLDELSMRRSIVTSVKGYLTQQSDNYRAPYAYNSDDRKRGFIIVATSNNDDILKDYTSDNERRWAIIKMSENSRNYINVNKAFEEGYRDKLWAFIKKIYDTGNYKLWLEDPELETLETEIQRNYKASNNADYNTIIDDILEREYGFTSDNGTIDIDYIYMQYRYGDSRTWCEKHNNEMNEKYEKANRGEYTLKPEDRLIKYWGKIDRIAKTDLYALLNKMNIEYTKPSLNAEMRNSKKWLGHSNGQRQCKINKKLMNGYWRIDKESLRKFDSSDECILPF